MSYMLNHNIKFMMNFDKDKLKYLFAESGVKTVHSVERNDEGIS